MVVPLGSISSKIGVHSSPEAMVVFEVSWRGAWRPGGTAVATVPSRIPCRVNSLQKAGLKDIHPCHPRRGTSSSNAHQLRNLALTNDASPQPSQSPVLSESPRPIVFRDTGSRDFILVSSSNDSAWSHSLTSEDGSSTRWLLQASRFSLRSFYRAASKSGSNSVHLC